MYTATHKLDLLCDSDCISGLMCSQTWTCASERAHESVWTRMEVLLFVSPPDNWFPKWGSGTSPGPWKGSKQVLGKKQQQLYYTITRIQCDLWITSYFPHNKTPLWVCYRKWVVHFVGADVTMFMCLQLPEIWLTPLKKDRQRLLYREFNGVLINSISNQYCYVFNQTSPYKHACTSYVSITQEGFYVT